MRKFPKLLAIVLAIAIVICPAMCLTTMAETPVNGYSVEYANDVLTIKVTSDTGFMVSFIKVAINGFTVDEDNVTVATKEGIEFAANPSYEEGVLSLLLAAKEAADIDLVTEATVTVPAVPNEEVDSYYIALTHIQAADAGTAEAPESFLEFEGVTTETGAVENIVPTVDGALHECTAVEYVDNGDGTHNGICDCADATIVVENEDHIDDDADNVCDFCEAELVVTPDTYTVTFVDETGAVLKTESVEANGAAVAPELPEKIGYSAAWDVDFSNITADTTVTAVYTEAVLTTKGMSAQIALKSSFQITYTFSKSNLGTGKLLYAVANKYVIDNGVEDYVPTVVREFAETSSGYSFDYAGIAAREMTSPIKVKFYYELDGVLYSSKEVELTIARLALIQMNKQDGTTAEGAAFLALGMDMLNYGAQAQQYYNYRTDDLANVFTYNDDTVAKYADYATKTNPDFSNVENASATGTHLYGLGFTLTLELGNAIGLNVEVKKGTADFKDYTFKFSYEDATGKLQQFSVPFTEIADKPNDSTRYLYTIREVAAKDLRKVISIAVYDGEGNIVTKTLTVAIAAYAKTQMTTDANIALVNAMFKYSDAAAYYFANFG